MLLLNATVYGQTKQRAKQQSHNPSRIARQKLPTRQNADSSAMVAPPVVVLQPVADTVKKDTVTQSVAADVKDTVAAQLKAPIVQLPVTLKSLIIPGVLFTYGALTLNNGKLREINEEVHEATARTDKKFQRPFTEDYMLYVPAVAVYGLNFAGVKGQNNFIDRSVIFLMSEVIANGMTYGVKRLGIETRPDTSDNHSFPSGHTSEAFISAEFFHQEYKGRVHWTAIAAGYAVAASVGYMRMYHNKHYLSDVVAGAGVGIAATRFSYYVYPLLKHVIFGSKKVKGDAMIMPTYRQGGGFGLAIVKRF